MMTGSELNAHDGCQGGKVQLADPADSRDTGRHRDGSISPPAHLSPQGQLIPLWSSPFPASWL